MEPCKCPGTKDSDDWVVLAVEYDVASGSLCQHPVAASTKSFNNLDGEVQVQQSLGYTVEVTEEETFTHTGGTSLEIGTTFDVGVPLVVNGKISTGLTVSSKHIWGKTTSTTKTITAVFPCVAPAHRYVVCEGLMNVVTVSVPYTMTIKHNHYGCTCTSEGVYKNVHQAGFYLETKAYISVLSRDEAKYVKSVENQSP